MKQVLELFAELVVNTLRRWKRDKLLKKRAGRKKKLSSAEVGLFQNIAKSRLGCNVSTGWAWSFLHAASLGYRSTAATRDKLKFSNDQQIRLRYGLQKKLQNNASSALLRTCRVELPVFASPWTAFTSFRSKVREVFHEGLAMEVLSSFRPIKPMPLPKCKTDILYLIKVGVSHVDTDARKSAAWRDVKLATLSLCQILEDADKDHELGVLFDDGRAAEGPHAEEHEIPAEESDQAVTLNRGRQMKNSRTKRKNSKTSSSQSQQQPQSHNQQQLHSHFLLSMQTGSLDCWL
eukprot:2683829-Amphidinium_carterae.2